MIQRTIKMTLAIALIAISICVNAQNKKKTNKLKPSKSSITVVDTLIKGSIINDTHSIEEVVVVGGATEKTPVAYTNINKDKLKKNNVGRDIPSILSGTPSLVFTSDAGAGIGYSSLRIRGVDATRINVTTNGVPINDSESHSVYWVNMPDLVSSLNGIQVQRGVGTSKNGAGAFGASINMQTNSVSIKPSADVFLSLGSYNTSRQTVQFTTGLIGGHWEFSGRLSNIYTDGYVDRASAKLQSYFAQMAYVNDYTTIKLLTFGGKERTYHAWNYASPDNINLYGRTYNESGFMFATDKDGNIFSKDKYKDANGKTQYHSLNGGKQHFYNDQIDLYKQQHYHLIINTKMTDDWKAMATLHYTKGDGFYREYKQGRKLKEFGLKQYTINGETIKKSDLVREKHLDNYFVGSMFSTTYDNKENFNLELGGALNRYKGDHFGKIAWIKNYVGHINPDDNYYFSTGNKLEANAHVRTNYQPIDNLNLYGDVQLRHISYYTDGTTDRWDGVKNAQQQFDITDKFNFINPKVGVSYQPNVHNRLYASFAVAHREPTRTNYLENKSGEKPRSERMFDYEMGYSFENYWVSFGANLYYMDYKDQLVPTGELSQTGRMILENVSKSYRAGVELTTDVRLPLGFGLNMNAALSTNKIKDFKETLYLYEEYTTDSNNKKTIGYGDREIAFSPNLVLNGELRYQYKGLEARLQSHYVSKQYLTNANLDNLSLDAYFVNNLHLLYKMKLPMVKETTVGLSLYNIFNTDYYSNGYAGSGLTQEGSNLVRYDYKGLSAQAGRNLMLNVAVSF